MDMISPKQDNAEEQPRAPVSATDLERGLVVCSGFGVRITCIQKSDGCRPEPTLY